MDDSLDDSEVCSAGVSRLKDNSSASESDSEQDDACNATRKRFTEAQKTCLYSYYRNGMTSTKKIHRDIISKAAKEAGLKYAQVERYIKRTSHKEAHSQCTTRTLPAKSKKRVTAWQVFLKEFGESDAGREAKKLLGVGNFSKAASAAYKELDKKEKERLKELAATTVEHTGCRRMKPREAKKAAANIIKGWQNQCEKLSELGYKAVAFGFSECDVQTASTADSASAMTPEVVDYMRSVLNNGQPTTAFSPPQPEEDSDNSCESDCQPESQSAEVVSPSLADEAQLFDMSTDHEFTTPPTTPTDATAHAHRYSSESSSPTPTSPCTSSTVPATLSSKLHSSSPEYTVSPGTQLSSYDTKSVLRLEYLGHFQPAAFTYSLSDSSHTHSENTPPPTPSLHEDGNESQESPSTMGCSTSQQSDPKYSTSPSVSVHERRRPNVRINSRPTKW